MYILTRVLGINRRRDLHKINLKPHNMRHLSNLIYKRNHRQQIHKRLPTLAIINQANLRLRLCGYAILQIKDRIVIAVFALEARRHFAVGRLQEPAVLADDLVTSVTREALEGFGCIFYGRIVCFGIADYEGAG